MVQIHVMDFEGSPTTGVVEFGLVSLRAGVLESCGSRFHRARTVIPAKDAQVHGLSTGMVSGYEPFQARYQDMVALRQGGVFAAHNAHVESNLIRDEWACPPFVPDWANSGRQIAEWGPWVDTLRIYRKLYPQLKEYRLASLLEVFQQQQRLDEWAAIHCPEGRRKYHCALYDALASALLIVRLFEQNILPPENWQQLLWWSGISPQVEWGFFNG